MKVTKQFLKKIILEAVKDVSAPSIINDGGELLELGEYQNLLISKGMSERIAYGKGEASGAAIYLQKIGNLAAMTPEEEKKLGMSVYDWKKKNDAVIKREVAKAKKLAPQVTSPQTPEKKGMFGLGFLGLEEEKKKENKMKITKEYLRRVIKEELEEAFAAPPPPPSAKDLASQRFAPSGQKSEFMQNAPPAISEPLSKNGMEMIVNVAFSANVRGFIERDPLMKKILENPAVKQEFSGNAGQIMNTIAKKLFIKGYRAMVTDAGEPRPDGSTGRGARFTLYNPKKKEVTNPNYSPKLATYIAQTIAPNAFKNQRANGLAQLLPY